MINFQLFIKQLETKTTKEIHKNHVFLAIFLHLRPLSNFRPLVMKINKLIKMLGTKKCNRNLKTVNIKHPFSPSMESNVYRMFVCLLKFW